MDNTVRESIDAFLAQYDTLAIATEHESQPYVTYTFFVEQPVEENGLTLYATFITTSRKLANLRNNPRVGLFIGPHQPTTWLEATAVARVVTDENEHKAVSERLGKKSSLAATFLARVPTVAVELRINWLRITNLEGGQVYTEATFPVEEETRSL
jgi:nitroimidazol reductase NimA-like FMN-containing flavoprotein (pyridoxamine 5'-phosphate oxidase superfamily)